MHPIWKLVSILTLGRVRTRAEPGDRSIYLTFDDGPHPEHTPALLSLLERHGARASFFMQGKKAAQFPEIVALVSSRGHSLGNHSYGHPHFPSISFSQQKEEIARTDRELERGDGKKRHDFRPPHGQPSIGTIVLCMIRRQRMLLWTHDSRDFQLEAREIIDRLASIKLNPGDVLLFHDDGGAALEVLDILMPRWRRAGFRFDAL